VHDGGGVRWIPPKREKWQKRLYYGGGIIPIILFFVLGLFHGVSNDVIALACDIQSAVFPCTICIPWRSSGGRRFSLFRDFVFFSCSFFLFVLQPPKVGFVFWEILQERSVSFLF